MNNKHKVAQSIDRFSFTVADLDRNLSQRHIFICSTVSYTNNFTIEVLFTSWNKKVFLSIFDNINIKKRVNTGIDDAESILRPYFETIKQL